MSGKNDAEERRSKNASTEKSKKSVDEGKRKGKEPISISRFFGCVVGVFEILGVLAGVIGLIIALRDPQIVIQLLESRLEETSTPVVVQLPTHTPYPTYTPVPIQLPTYTPVPVPTATHVPSSPTPTMVSPTSTQEILTPAPPLPLARTPTPGPRGQWITYRTSDGLIDNDVQAITSDKEGNMWIATEHGVNKFDGANWTQYRMSWVHDVFADEWGNVWIATTDDVRVLTQDGNWVSYTAQDGLLVGYACYAVNVDRVGNPWVGSSSGVSWWNGSTWETRRNPSFSARSIAIDETGNVWVGTSDGVHKFNGTTWTVYTTAEGLAHNWVHDIAFDEAGNVWFATGSGSTSVGAGASKFDGRNWTTYSQPGSANAIAVDREGNIWVGGYQLHKYDGNAWTTYSTNDGLVDNHVNAIYIDSMGDIWIGTEHGVSKLSR